MNFLFLGIFSGFLTVFPILFSIFFTVYNNLNKKIKKLVRGLRGCDVARRATWQRHADPAQRLRGATYIRIFIYYIYKMFFVLPYMGRVIPLETVGYYKPDGFI